MATEIKLSKSNRSEGLKDINPFNVEERDTIVQAIATDQFCTHKVRVQTQSIQAIEFILLSRKP
jgi:hypothetical protein